MKGRRSFKVALWFSGLAILLPLAVAAPISATAIGNISVSPGELNFILAKPGDQQSVAINITNNYASAIRLTAQFEGISENNGSLVPNGVLHPALANSLHLSETDILVPAHSSQVVTAEFSDNASLSPGGHYATLVLSQTSAGSQLALREDIALTIFAIKQSGAHEAVNLTKLQLNGWLFALPNTATTTFQNTGNVHIVPRAAITITAGKTIVAQGIDNQGSLPILPSHQLTTGALIIGKSRVWLPGRVRIQVTYRADGLNSVKTVTHYRWYIPPFYPLLILAIGFGIRWGLPKWRNIRPGRLFKRVKRTPDGGRIITIRDESSPSVATVKRVPKKPPTISGHKSKRLKR